MTANSGESITLPSSTLSEYTLKGWYTAASGGIKAGDAGDTYAVTRNITLYAQWQGGAEGSPTNPLQIGTAEQLRAFGTRVTNSETTLCAELTADITVENWATIGTPGSGAAKSSKPYTGTFDGNGYTLTLSKTDTTAINMALFHTIGTEGAVRELELIVTFSGLRNIAGVAVYNFGTIESVIVKGTITSSRTGVSESDIGGIAAYNSIEKINGVQIPGKILYCLNRASISGGTCVGGIAGSFKGEMRYCGNEGAVTGGTAGGLLCTAAGFSTNNQEIFIVSDCYNTGSIHRNYSSTVNTSGGLIGGSLLPLSSWRKTSHAINNLFSYGKVTELNSPQTNIICGAIYENTAVFYHFTNLYYLAGIGDRLFGNADLNGADGLGTDEVKELVHVKSAAEFKSADMAAALNGTRKGDDAPWEYVPGNDYPTLKAAGSE
jgi:hypothetical protein